MSKELPYTFDLLWDIKNEEQLIWEYVQAKQKVKDMEELCELLDIDLNKLIAEYVRK